MRREENCRRVCPAHPLTSRDVHSSVRKMSQIRNSATCKAERLFPLVLLERGDSDMPKGYERCGPANSSDYFSCAGRLIAGKRYGM
jgi:hypothetical protein